MVCNKKTKLINTDDLKIWHGIYAQKRSLTPFYMREIWLKFFKSNIGDRERKKFYFSKATIRGIKENLF